MESLTDYFEELIEDIGDDVRGSDVEYSVCLSLLPCCGMADLCCVGLQVWCADAEGW